MSKQSISNLATSFAALVLLVLRLHLDRQGSAKKVPVRRGILGIYLVRLILAFDANKLRTRNNVSYADGMTIG